MTTSTRPHPTGTGAATGIATGATTRGPAQRPDRIELQAPPVLEPREGAAGVLMNAIPMLGSLGSIVLVASMAGGDGANTGRSLLAAGMFLFATIGFVVVQVDRQRKQRSRTVTMTRADYLQHLAGARTAVRDAGVRQRRALTRRHPEPASLPAIAAEGSLLWGLTAADPQFLHVRYGRCDQPLAVELAPPDGPPNDRADPVSVSGLRRLLAVHRLQPALPAAIDLRAFGRVELCGSSESTRSLARALVCSATACHAPDDLVVAVLCNQQRLAHWDWVKWLPHAASTRRYDAVGPRRLVATAPAELAALLPPGLTDRPRSGADGRAVTPHLLLVLDGIDPPPDRPGTTVLDLSRDCDEPVPATGVRFLLEDRGDRDDHSDRVPVHAIRRRAEPVRADADQCPLVVAEAFARRLTARYPGPGRGAGHRPPGVGGSGEVGGAGDHLALLGVRDLATYRPSSAWHGRQGQDLLRVPIGLGEDGGPVHLDLKESAQQGMGPHGLVIGATGSGKSEFLRTLVLGLAMTHSPEQLNLVLVDFKGGATFAGMTAMPHVSAVITNLAEELSLVDRMQDALSGELVRRQELLREAGNLASVRDYDRARASGADLAPLPSLLIVVDEFSELLSARPELVDLFVAVGRLGRSLGLHLLLASQRLEEGRLRGLESHLSYRVGLRTFSAEESRAVLGVPDAYQLPPVPGLGYLKPGPGALVRFTAAYVSGPPPAPTPARHREPETPGGILPYTVVEVAPTAAAETAAPAADAADRRRETGHETGPSRSLLETAVDRMSGHGPAAHRVWLPPLETPETLDLLLPDLVVHRDLGLHSPSWRARGGLVVPLGSVDRPREQRREALTVDLGGAAGHLAAVGGPRSGKSTLLRTTVTGLALTSTPRESQFFVLDFGGGTFAPLADLPHVAGVATRSEPEAVRRVLAEVTGLLDGREGYFREQGIDSIETYRSRRAAGRADDGYGDVFLVVDGWGTLRADFEDLEEQVQRLCTRGLAYGLHLVAATSRWADFRTALRDAFGTRLELRLGDPLDSEIDRGLAGLVPAGRPGRGLVPTRHHVLVALPRIDGDASAGTLADGVVDLVGRVRDAWTGAPAPRLRLLPRQIELDRVRALAGAADGSAAYPGGPLLLGLDEQRLAPVPLALDPDPHLLVFGDGRSGKSTLLRGLVHEVLRTRSPRQAQVVLVDYRRSLLGEVPDEHLFAHLTSAPQAQPVLADLARHLEHRLPGPGVTPHELRTRSWWQGAEVFVVVDDHDLVATAQGSPLQVLQPLLPHARDVGLHVILARRTGGASRALYEPTIQTLRDLAQPTLVLSGDPDEGPLAPGVRPMPLPPGRGRLVTRDGGVQVVQVAWTAPPR